MDACKAGVMTKASTCDGAGACKDKPFACDPYACGATACKTVCTSGVDCAAGSICDLATSKCAAAPGLGAPCTAGSCSGGLFCTDGVCCGVASCDAGKSCALAATKGKCASPAGSACASPTECGTGFCVDGVCCDTKCDGQCEACDGATKGTCAAVTGAPRGARASCAAGADICKTTTCDGVERASCKGLPGATTVCKPKLCSGDARTADSACNGAGGCVTPAATTCAPYACDGLECRTACTSDDHCASGYTCVATKCEPKKSSASTCDPDGITIVGPDSKPAGTCGIYRCKNGACGTQCGSSSDCVVGYACDVASKTCLPNSGADTGDSGGCALGGPSTSPGAWLFAWLGLVASAARRRTSSPGHISP